MTCVGYRNVGLLAKEAACIDVFSGGRMILGLGAGWYEREYRAYGYSFPTGRERLAHLDEALSVIPRLWRETTVTFDGDHVHLDGAFCEPKPLQAHLPILVGGGGEKVTLRIEARHADLTNWQVGLEGFIHKSELLAGYCADDRPAVRRHRANPRPRLSDLRRRCGDARAWCESPGGGHLWGGVDTETYLRDNLVGTVEQVIDKAQGFVDAGCRQFVLWLRDLPADDTLTTWMREIAPALRG